MAFKIPTIISLSVELIGVGLMVIPNELAHYIGWPFLVLGQFGVLWVLCSWLYLRNLAKQVDKKAHTKFLKANFDAIGMSTPYIDFYFEIHSCLSNNLILTGTKRGNIWNPYVEPWKAVWNIDVAYQDIIKPNSDTKIKIRWFVPQGHHNSPMADLAFTADNKTPVQELSFEDIFFEVKTRFLWIESKIGWVQLPKGITTIPVPNHPIFNTIRQIYLKERIPEDVEHDKLFERLLDSQG